MMARSSLSIPWSFPELGSKDSIVCTAGKISGIPRTSTDFPQRSVKCFLLSRNIRIPVIIENVHIAGS